MCISILHKPGGTAEIPDDTPASECWRPILNIEAIIVSVLSMLSDPNFSSPANLDASVRPPARLQQLAQPAGRLLVRSLSRLRSAATHRSRRATTQRATRRACWRR